MNKLRCTTFYRFRVEAAEWIQPTLDLGVTVGHTSSAVFYSASGWALMRSDAPAAVGFAERALESSQSDDDRALAQAAKIWGLGLCGRVPDAIAAVDTAREQLQHPLAPISRLLLLEAVISATPPGESMSEEVSSHSAAAKEIGAPAVMAEASRYRGQHLAIFTDPPDLAGAIDTLRNSIELAESAGSITTLVWSRFSLSVVMVWAGHPDAAETMTRSLDYAADRRQLYAVDRALDASALYLASVGSLDAAAVLLGHTQRSAAGFPAAEVVRQQARELVGASGEHQSFLDRGAAMDRSEAVAFALARLAEHAPADR